MALRFPIYYIMERCSEWFLFSFSSSSCNNFSCYLSIRPHVLSDLILYSKIISLPLYPVAGLSSCILHPLGGIFFRYFGIYCFVCLYCLTLCRYFLSLPFVATIFWLISSNCIVSLIWCFVLVFSSQQITSCFFFVRYFIYCPSSLISHLGFEFLFDFIADLFRCSIIQRCNSLGYLEVISLEFWFLH